MLEWPQVQELRRLEWPAVLELGRLVWSLGLPLLEPELAL